MKPQYVVPIPDHHWIDCGSKWHHQSKKGSAHIFRISRLYFCVEEKVEMASSNFICSHWTDQWLSCLALRIVSMMSSSSRSCIPAEQVFQKLSSVRVGASVAHLDFDVLFWIQLFHFVGITGEWWACDVMRIQAGRSVRPGGLHNTLYTDLIIMLIWDRLSKLQAQSIVYTQS